LDEKEKKYAEEYNKIIEKHSKNVLYHQNDLTKDMLPPNDLFVEVLASENLEVKTKIGSKNLLKSAKKLEKNSTYNLRRSEVEHLVRKGLLTINE
jgi:hypothetical protein